MSDYINLCTLCNSTYMGDGECPKCYAYKSSWEDMRDRYKEAEKEEKPKATDKQVGGSHYKDMAIQPGKFIRANNIGWYEGNAIKYICRHNQKAGRQDIEKAIHYLELVLEEYD